MRAAQGSRRRRPAKARNAAKRTRSRVVEMPIAEALDGVLHRGLAPRDAVASLLDRDPKAELASGG